MTKLGLDVIASASHLSPKDRREYLAAMQREANAAPAPAAPARPRETKTATAGDFERVARILREKRQGYAGAEQWDAALEATARAFADDFATINPRFDRRRFLKACGVEA